MSALRGTIEGYLRAVGFDSYVNDAGVELWGHADLGWGRTFGDVVAWQMGREDAAARAHLRLVHPAGRSE